MKDILESRIGKRPFDLRNDASGLFRNVSFKIACLLDARFLALEFTGAHHGAQGSARLSTVNVNWLQSDRQCTRGTRLVTVPPTLIVPQVKCVL